MKNIRNPEEERIARVFCEFIYEVPADDTFTLWNVQGALRTVNQAVPDHQKYAEQLRVATETGWIEPVGGQPDSYRRIRHGNQSRQRSAYMRAELQALKDRMIYATEGREWVD